jgi:signal peptidase I
MPDDEDREALAADEDARREADALAAAEEHSDGAGEKWWAWVGFAAAVVLIAMVERTLFFQPYNIPSGSMEETLLVGDYLFVEKFAYGYSRYSLPFGRFLPSFGRVLAHPPRRGDVVVFVPPNDPSTVYIKRIVGLPGERVRMTDGVLYIDDMAVPKVRVADFPPTKATPPVARFRETLPGGVTYYVLDAMAEGPEDNTQTYTVPGGHYFMMGDNRDDSNDSRMDVGFVPAENLVGKAQLRFFSIDGTQTQWWEFWTWPGAVRFERMFGFIT